MRKYVRLAASMDIVIVWCLWNGAVLRDNRTLAMITEPSGATLSSFVANALTPLVAALSSEVGIGAWEIMNEPEGSVAPDVPDAEPCFDTVKLKNTGAGWSQKKKGGTPLSMKYLQRFVAVQAAAIHAADPGALVTVGSWNAVANTDVGGHTNYWSDSCLELAAGPDLWPRLGAPTTAQRRRPGLDFYQVHSYPGSDGFDGLAPFTGLNRSFYSLGKPLVIGEFPAAPLNGGYTDTELYQYAHAAGFDGAWVRTADPAKPQLFCPCITSPPVPGKNRFDHVMLHNSSGLGPERRQRQRHTDGRDGCDPQRRRCPDRPGRPARRAGQLPAGPGPGPAQAPAAPAVLRPPARRQAHLCSAEGLGKVLCRLYARALLQDLLWLHRRPAMRRGLMSGRCLIDGLMLNFLKIKAGRQTISTTTRASALLLPELP